MLPSGMVITASTPTTWACSRCNRQSDAPEVCRCRKLGRRMTPWPAFTLYISEAAWEKMRQPLAPLPWEVRDVGR